MRFLLIAFAILCSVAQAAPIDSSISGVYLGNSRVCNIIMSRYQTFWVQADIRCLSFSGGASASLTTIYAPGSCPQGGAYSLTPWAPNEYLSLISFNPQNIELNVIIGTNQNSVYNGIGTTESWYRLAALASPSPYSCSSAVGRKP